MAGTNFFLIGSGFTKAVFDNAPLNSELLKALIGAKPATTPLGRASMKYGINDDIEVLLTKFDIDVNSLPPGQQGAFTCHLTKEREEINKQIALFFHKYRFKELQLKNNPWLKEFALDIIRPNDKIINLNYDSFLEGLLDFHGVWSPNGGYGCIENTLTDSLPKNQKGIVILKIHGSENFRAASYFDNPTCKAVSFDINSDIFPKSGAHSFLGGVINSQPYIVAPSYVKIPKIELSNLMIDALKFAQDAQNFIIIGCGLRRNIKGSDLKTKN